MRSKILIRILVIIFISLFQSVNAQKQSNFKISAIYHLTGAEPHDDLSISPNGKIYLSHNSHIDIIDKNTGDSVGVIPNTPSVHGIAFAEKLGKGYATNGANTVTIFDFNKDMITGQIAVGNSPDGILYEPFTKTIVVCNERSHDITVIDPVSDKITKVIPLSGSPEAPFSNGRGKLFVNIKKGHVDVINLKTWKLENQFELGTGNKPTGLSMDIKTDRLFVGTTNKLLFVLNGTSGQIIDSLPIGIACDGVVFDPITKYIFTPDQDANLTVIHENSANKYEIVANVKTAKYANIIAIDIPSHTVFLPAPYDYDKIQKKWPPGIQMLKIEYH
jgi:DNA-binding beta-propeller fold protein YncE